MSTRILKTKKRSSAAFGLSPGERVMGAVNVFLLIIIGLLMVLPFLNTVAKSFSSNNAITTGKVIFTPVDFQLGTYKYVMGQSQFWDSLRVSVLITLMGTAGAMTISCLTAYPLSKTWLFGRKPAILFFVFTMLFSGGMVPNYLLMRSLGLINTLWVLFVPGMLSVYNVILLKNFFEDIPEAIEESAQLDGAGNVRTLVSIVLPMSLPALATIGLFYAVGYWDNYMTGLLYITKPDLRPLQTYLYVIVTEAVNIDETLSMDALENIALNTEAIRAATIVLACVHKTQVQWDTFYDANSKAAAFGFEGRPLTFARFPEYTEYSSALSTLCNDYFLQVIAGTETLDSYDDFVKEWEEAGGLALEEAATAWYHENPELVNAARESTSPYNAIFGYEIK